MKKLFWSFILVIILFVSWRVYTKSQAGPGTDFVPQDAKESPQAKDSSPTESTFVTYWTLGADAPLAQYDEVYYFGVAATPEGIDRNDDGFARISQFLDKTAMVPKRFLVIRMVDKDINSEVLKSRVSQERIVQDSVRVAEEYGFDGVVLDFEISSIGFDSVTNRVSNFYTLFAGEVKQKNLMFYVTLYGDTYYRVRAYDIKHIGALSDKVLVMTYDFHKSRGNPGPNFPLRGKETYGYDLTQMIQDFQKDLPTGKITVIFGMFGYDWSVDAEGKSTDSGIAASYFKIQQSFIDSCEYTECIWEKDRESTETRVEYTDDTGEKHIIWFENPDSIREKRDYLQSIGVEDIAYWAYSYY